MPPRSVLLALLGLAACAAAPRLSRADVAGTTWREVCPSPEIATAYVRLEPSGLMAWSYADPGSVRVDTVHTWAVEDGALWLRWNGGSARTRYRAGRYPGRLTGEGSTFCLDGPWLERVE